MNDPGIRSRIHINTALFLEESVGGDRNGYLAHIKEGWETALRGRLITMHSRIDAAISLWRAPGVVCTK